jgi:thiosulfate/3-mercaptopyruvate sulfurtransferase
MKLKISLFVFLIGLLSCQNEDTAIEQSKLTAELTSDYLIEVDEVLKIKDNPNVKILDFRKAKFYLEEHITGALNIWRTDIEDTSYAYGGMMASKEQIESLFSELGINSNDTILIYDDNGLCDSARLWWLLQNYNFTNVKLFHGGMTDWKLNNGIVSKSIPTVEKTVFTLPETSSMKYYISKDEMLKSLNSNTLILDTRTGDEYSGKQQKKGAFKGGRIPNSKLIDWAAAVDYNGDRKFKSIDELNRIYAKFASKEDTIIVYCHSGVRSAHTTFVLTQLLGYENVKNYDGSWTEWSYFDDLPFKQDSLTAL